MKINSSFHPSPFLIPTFLVKWVDSTWEKLGQLTDEVGEDENHPLASLMDVLGVLIEKYEDEHVAELET